MSDVELPNTNCIQLYLHCKLCLAEATMAEQSPKDYARYEAGWTKQGLQLWCKRHEVNILHIDFEGQQHPANSTRKLQS